MLRHHFIERDDIETKYIIDIVKVVEMLCYQPLQPASIEMTRERERIYSMMSVCMCMYMRVLKLIVCVHESI